MSKHTQCAILSLILSLVIFFVLLAFTNWILAVLLTALSYAYFAWAITPKRVVMVVNSYEKTLNDFGKRMQSLHTLMAQIEKPSMRERLDRIVVLANQVFDWLKEHPDKAGGAYLGYLFDTTIKILAKYISLTKRGLDYEQLNAVIERAEDSLAKVEKSFEEQLRKMLQGEVLDLGVEIDVFEKMAKINAGGTF